MTAKYQEIKELIIEQVDQGQFSAHQRLPSERLLAESFGTTRVTLREALSSLEAEGRLYREVRRGWFISPLPVVYDPNSRLGYEKVIESQNRSLSTLLIKAKLELANTKACRALGLKAFTKVIAIHRVHTIDNRPVVYAINYITSELFPGLLKRDLSHSLIDLYKEQYNIEGVTQNYSIYASNIDHDMANPLHTKQGTQALVIEKTNFSEGNCAFEFSIDYWRHDAIRIESYII
ncbi:UTRA domain-containing protein [Vibrio sp. S4M6]|uniref:UTRA domain-containing protein n=1 Tax=Vibrio sinus TaxID=2946865 RepID=UPI00202AB033|nr:UTRA domain-containing protein [Vibrio sinus]MCL9779818.1 UTRA domain-containing protein [Vibrio sinus]